MINKAPIPKEHGMWGIFLVPVVVSLIATRKINIPMLLLLFSAILFFLGRHSLVLIIKSWQKDEKIMLSTVKWSTIYFFLSLVSFLPLVIYYNLDKLYYFAATSVFFLLLNIIQVWLKKQRVLLNEITGIISLTFIGPAIHYVLMGDIDLFMGLVLWLGCTLYFVGTIFSVRSRTVDKHYDLISLLYYACILVSIFVLSFYFNFSWILLLSYIPVFIKSLYSYLAGFKKLNIRTVGLIEGIHSAIFALLLGILLIYSKNI